MNIFMKMLPTSVFFLTGLASAQDTMRSVNPTQFDVGGIRIGMPREQAIQELMDHFHVAKDQLQFEEIYANPVTKTEGPGRITLQQGTHSIDVHFVAKIPFDPAHTMVADDIIYSAQMTPENDNLIFSAAVQKYGPPSSGNSQSASWCSSPPFCRGQAQLTFAQSSLRLYDPTLQKAVTTYIQAAKTDSPAF